MKQNQPAVGLHCTLSRIRPTCIFELIQSHECVTVSTSCCFNDVMIYTHTILTLQ